ncbi:hypothetical protein AVEN_208366-1 [Araneus ventricosus]|uniref:Saposin B-type domain-containing protein n=1 Tax=Araneus ventricosus TaxID=182803 RepID=A0A4Y2FHX7_ARAVE|nr:hypothetical protein AVEN_208366-1 [Araneus ventricosus]
MKGSHAFLIVGSTLLAFFAISRHQTSASTQDELAYDEAENFEVHKKMLSCIACSKDDESRTDYISCMMMLPDGCREWMKKCGEKYVKEWEEIDDFFTKLCGNETAIKNVIECSKPPNEHCKPIENQHEEEKKIIKKYRTCVMNVVKNHCES